MMRWSWEVGGRVETAVWDDGLFVSSSFGLEILADALVASQEIVECGLLGPSRVAGFGDEVVAWGTISEALAQYCNALGFVEFIEWAECPVIPEEENDDDNSFMSKVADALAKASFGGDRSAAGRYAAEQRWKNHKKDDAPVSWDTPTDDLEIAKATGRPISWLQYGSLPKGVQDVIDKRMAEYDALSEKISKAVYGSIEYQSLWRNRSAVAIKQKAEMQIAVELYAKSVGMSSREAEICAKAIYRTVATHDYDRIDPVHTVPQEERLGIAVDSVKDAEVVIATPIEVAEQMLRTDLRFKSQFETGSSRGTLNTEARAEQEAANFGLHPNVNPSMRPIYGYIRKGGVEYKDIIQGEVRQYGEVHFVLKKSVNSRSTFTCEDSLMQPMHPSPVNKPNYLAALPFIRLGASRYDEAQVHGGVSISDVDRVVMPRQVAKAMIDYPMLKSSLDKLGIPVELV